MRSVATIEIDHIQSFKDRHGKRRFYYRRAGHERTALPDPASEDFLTAYAKAAKSKSEIAVERTIPRSISALIIAYYGSQYFKDLQPQTQATYRNMLDRFREALDAKGRPFGKGPAGIIKAKTFRAYFATMTDKPGALRNLRKRLRKVFDFAIEEEWRIDNPILATKGPKAKGVGFIPWSEDEIDRYRAYWPTGTRERLALEVLLNTAVRRSDAVLLGHQHVTNGRIRLKQVKTGEPVTVPLHRDLLAELEGRVGMTFILTKHGSPFSAAGFTNWFVEKATEAGCPKRTPHGLRKAAGRRLAEAGCSAKQVAAVLGHATTRMAELYTEDADRQRLADDAFENLAGTKVRKPRLSNHSETVTVQGVAEASGRPGRTGLAVEYQDRRRSNRRNRTR